MTPEEKLKAEGFYEYKPNQWIHPDRDLYKKRVEVNSKNGKIWSGDSGGYQSPTDRNMDEVINKAKYGK